MMPQLSSLPEAQRAFWPELRIMPPHFVLYGGTAIALRLGGRQSVDFDFFSSDALDVEVLVHSVPFLRDATLIQSAPNTASWLVRLANVDIKISCLGGLTFGRVGCPEVSTDNGVPIAALHDLAAQKVKVVQVRAEAKDYLDLDLLMKSGVSLEDALGAACALYPHFAIMPTLKALGYFEDGDLKTLPEAVKQRLAEATQRFRAPTSVSRTSHQLHV
jgi:hypothetical protein